MWTGKLAGKWGCDWHYWGVVSGRNITWTNGVKESMHCSWKRWSYPYWIWQHVSLNDKQISQDCQQSNYCACAFKEWESPDGARKSSAESQKTYLTNWNGRTSSQELLCAAVFGVPLKDVHESHSHLLSFTGLLLMWMVDPPPSFLRFGEKHAGRSTFAWKIKAPLIKMHWICHKYRA